MITTSARSHVNTLTRDNRSFENLLVWQEAHKLVIKIYQISKLWKDYSLKDQIQRAIVSVVSNIAEGYERGSVVDFDRFLYIARGSVSEVRAQWYVARDLGYINQMQFEEIYDKLDHIARMLGKLISSNKKVSTS